MNTVKLDDRNDDAYEHPPLLTREIYDDVDEEEDTFIEMEEETDEEEDSPLQQEEPTTSNFSAEDTVQTQCAFETIASEEVIHIGSRYPRRESVKEKFDFDHNKYVIGYRDSQYKSKKKMSHKVAIIAKVDENMCHEFSYNRTSEFDGNVYKYYSCLGCRRAKTDTKMKDVIRTIRIDERYRQIVSKNDPFYGHHYACEPIPWAPDSRTYGHVLRQPMHMDLGEYAPSELVYVEADGTEEIWEPTETNGLINLASIPFYGEEGPPPRKMKEGVAKKTKGPFTITSAYQRYKKKRKLTSKSRKPQCHLCFTILTSTSALIRHLQRHLQKPK